MLGFPDDSLVKNLPANAGDMGWILELGRSPGEGNGPVFLSGKSYRQRSLASYNPWGHRK